MNVWRLITHHTDPEHTLQWTKKTGRIAIGWGRIGDIKKQGYASAQKISRSITAHYAPFSRGCT